MDHGERITIAETALLTAFARSRETLRSDRLFADDFAASFLDGGAAQQERLARLLGDGGDVIAVRTALVDKAIRRLTKESRVQTVLNIGAGLDTRPYRMVATEACRFIEVDDGRTIAFKEERLAGATANSPVSRFGFDLRGPDWLERVLHEVGEVGEAVIIAEGLFTYLSADETERLVSQLAEGGRFRYLVGDLVSPGAAVRLRNSVVGDQSDVQFHVLQDLSLFERNGWVCVDYQPLTAAIRRLRPSSSMGLHFQSSAPRTAGQLVDGVARFELS